MTKIAVSMATLKSHNHIIDDIERGIKVFNNGGIEITDGKDAEWLDLKPNGYMARVPHKGGTKTVNVVFTNDGQDIAAHFCDCTWQEKKPPICRHVVAAVLAIQGRVIESGIMLGKSATAQTLVSASKTAKAVGSGNLDVFATPMMIALMEEAACNCLADGLESGQSSVGTKVNVSHTAVSPLGATITATATVEAVFGRRIEFKVTASDGTKEVGAGTHTRMIIDAEKFMSKLQAKI